MLYERQHLAILKSRMAETRRRMQIIMGPRQVGKSTLVGQYVNSIDIPYDFFAADGVNREDTAWIPARWQEARMKMDLHGEKERILIIDEVQKIKTWSEQVKKNGMLTHERSVISKLFSSAPRVSFCRKDWRSLLKDGLRPSKWDTGSGTRCGMLSGLPCSNISFSAVCQAWLLTSRTKTAGGI